MPFDQKYVLWSRLLTGCYVCRWRREYEAWTEALCEEMAHTLDPCLEWVVLPYNEKPNPQ